MRPESETSLDPAMAGAPRVLTHGSVLRLCVEPGGVYAFDFDGVIASNLEDRVYRAAIKPGERAATTAAATALGVRCDGMEYRYQRHLVYQAALWHLGMPIQCGPALQDAQEASRSGHLFVLTARSGWFAVERCRTFLAQHDILPVEIFHVGRVGKVAQIALLCREFPQQPIHFIEDSQSHLDLVTAANVGDVRPILINEQSADDPDDSALHSHYLALLDRAIVSINRNGLRRAETGIERRRRSEGRAGARSQPIPIPCPAKT